MKNLLLFAYFYPPLGGPGVQRPLKLVKYLHENDWQTSVITVKDIMFHSSDEKMLLEDKATTVVRTSSLDFMAIFKKISGTAKPDTVYFRSPERIKKIIRSSFPIDDKIGWLPFAYKAGKDQILTRKYDAIMATMGPYTSGIVAYRLSKKYRIPLIIDYRDHWTMNPYLKYITPILKAHAEKWEKKLLHHASVITTVSQMMKDDLESKFGENISSKIHVMYNGWDAADFAECNTRKDNKKITFSYIGNFYGHRTPEYFVKAIEELVDENMMPDDVVINFIGNYYIETVNLLQSSKVSKFINIIPQVPHQDAIEYLMSSDALLLFIASHKGKGVLTGKLFEYLRSQKEILAMIPADGEAATLLKKYNHDFIGAMEDVKKIKKDFIAIYNRIKLDKKCEHVFPVEFSREEQAKQFLTFLEKKI